LLDVSAEVETVLRVNSPLIPAAGILVEDVCEAQAMQQGSGREAEQNFPSGRLAP
jgi:hypothetical protein